MDQGKGRALGAILAESEMITPADIEQALAEQRRTGVRIGEALVNLGIVSAEDVRWGLAQQLNIPFVRVRSELVDPEAVRAVPEDVARRHRMVPYLLIGDELTVIVEDPTSKRAIADLESITGKHVTVAIGLSSDIDRALGEIYGPGSGVGLITDDLISEMFTPEQQSLVRADYTGKRFLQELFVEAERRNASSIHFEPRRDAALIRLRAGGGMLPVAQLSRAWARGIIQRLKASMFDVERRTGSCEGFYRAEFADRQLIYHVSCVETSNGDSLTLVNLAPHDFPTALDQLRQHTVLANLLSAKRGLVVLAGPERPEKYRLLGLLLAAKGAATRKTIVIGRIPWFVDAGYIQLRPTAERWEEVVEVLRIAWGQDPDLLAIDDLTQPRVLNAVLDAGVFPAFAFGGLRLPTVAAGIEYLLESASSRSVLCSTLRGLVGYTTLPRLCSACRVPDDRPARIAHVLGPADNQPPVWRPQGCAECGGTGFLGVHVLVEALSLDEKSIAAIKAGEPAERVLRLLAPPPENSLLAQARLLAREGEAAIDDVALLMGNGSHAAN